MAIEVVYSFHNSTKEFWSKHCFKCFLLAFEKPQKHANKTLHSLIWSIFFITQRPQTKSQQSKWQQSSGLHESDHLSPRLGAFYTRGLTVWPPQKPQRLSVSKVRKLRSAHHGPTNDPTSITHEESTNDFRQNARPNAHDGSWDQSAGPQLKLHSLKLTYGSMDKNHHVGCPKQFNYRANNVGFRAPLVVQGFFTTWKMESQKETKLSSKHPIFRCDLLVAGRVYTWDFGPPIKRNKVSLGL